MRLFLKVLQVTWRFDFGMCFESSGRNLLGGRFDEQSKICWSEICPRAGVLRAEVGAGRPGGVGEGVGIPFIENEKVSKFQSFQVSQFQRFKLKFQIFKLQNFQNNRFGNLFNVFGKILIPYYQSSVSCLLEACFL